MSITCRHCPNETFAKRSSLYRHEKSKKHADNINKAIAVESLPCLWEGCLTRFARADIRARHIETIHEGHKRKQSAPSRIAVKRRKQAIDIDNSRSSPDSNATGGKISKSSPNDWTSLIFWHNCSSDTDDNAGGQDLEIVSSTQTTPSNSGMHNDATTEDAEMYSPIQTKPLNSVLHDNFSCDKLRETLPKLGPLSPARVRSTTNTCRLCGQSFGSMPAELTKHMQEHVQSAQFKCDICQVWFKQKADHDLHKASAASSERHCGFEFKHTTQCSGHHPPPESNVGMETDHERLQKFANTWSVVQYNVANEFAFKALLQGQPSWNRVGSVDARHRPSCRLDQPAATIMSVPACVYSGGRMHDPTTIPMQMEVLRNAITKSHPDRACALIDQQIENIPQEQLTTLLFDAVRDGLVNVAEILLDRSAALGSDIVNYVHPDLGTALRVYVTFAPLHESKARLDLLDLLLKRGADIHKGGPNGTPLEAVRRQLNITCASADKRGSRVFRSIQDRMTGKGEFHCEKV